MDRGSSEPNKMMLDRPAASGWHHQTSYNNKLISILTSTQVLFCFFAFFILHFLCFYVFNVFYIFLYFLHFLRFCIFGLFCFYFCTFVFYTFILCHLVRTIHTNFHAKSGVCSSKIELVMLNFVFCAASVPCIRASVPCL